MLRGRDRKDLKEFFQKEFAEFKEGFYEDFGKVLEKAAKKSDLEWLESVEAVLAKIPASEELYTKINEAFERLAAAIGEQLNPIREELRKLANPLIIIDPQKFDPDAFKKLNPGVKIQLVNTSPVVEVEDDSPDNPAEESEPQKRGPGRPRKNPEE